MLRSNAPIRSQLLCGTALVGLAFVVLYPHPALAGCDNNFPGSGATVTCTTTGGDDLVGVDAPASNNVTVNMGGSAVIDVTGDFAVNLNASATLNLSAGATITNDTTDTVSIGGGNVNLNAAGANISAQSVGTDALVTTDDTTIVIQDNAFIQANGDATARGIVYVGGSAADTIYVNLAGDIIADVAGTAIDYGASTATLLLKDTANIIGNVIAAAGGTDSLILGGTASGALDMDTVGAGLKFRGFDSFTKQDTGSWTLSGTGSQNWSITAGSLIGTTASMGGNLAVSLGASATLQGASGTHSGNITGAGSLTVQGGNTITLAGTNTYSGGTTINTAGTTLVGTTTSLTGNIASTAGTQIVRFDQGGSGTYSGNYSGSGALQVQGGGTLTLSGTNTYSGGTAISGASTTLIGTTSSLAGGAYTSAAASNILRIDQAANASFAGDYSGLGALQVQGGGDITLTGSMTHTGGTSVSGAGTRLIGTTSNLSGNISAGAGTEVEFAQAGGGTYSGNLSGSGALVKTGAGTVILGGTNTYTGGTTVNGGSLSIDADADLGDVSSNLTLSGGGLVLTGSITSARDVTLGGSNGTFDTGANDLTLNGDISGSGGFTKLGTGTLALGGTNTYSGNITLTGGEISGNTASIKGNISTAGGTTVTFDQSSGGTYTGNITGTGALVKDNSGLLSLTGTNSYTGGTTINNGTLRVNASSITGNISNAATLEFQQTSDGTFSGDISGIGGFIKSGGGNLTLSGNNNYTGGTNITNGTLTGTTTSIQGDVTSSGTLVLTDGGAATYSGTYSGSGLLTYSGGGTLTLSGNNTHTGGTRITTSGTVVVNADNNLGNAASTLTFNDGTLRTDTGFSTARNLTLEGGTGTVNTNGNNLSVSGNVTGVGALSKTGAGILTLSGANTYSGGTSITGGTIAVSDDNDLGSTSGALTLNGGTLQTNSAFTSTRDISLTGAGTVNTNGNNITISGNVSGVGGFTKSGAGNLTFSGTNTYAGGTTLNAGSITGTTANITGDISTAGGTSVIFDQGSTGTYAGVVSGGGSIVKNGAGTVTLSGVNTHTGGVTINAGTLIASAENNLGNAAGALTIDGGTLQYNGAFSTTRTTTIGSNDATINTNGNNITMSGIMSGAGGALAKTGTGTLTLTGVNTFTDGVTITGGTVAIAAESGLGDAGGNLTLNGGTIQYNGAVATNRTTTLGASNGTVNTNGNSVTMSGIISGTGSLTKTGGGTLSLTGVNTYTGGTTVTTGNIGVSADSNLGALAGGLTLNGGGLFYDAAFDSSRLVSIGASNGTINTNGFTVSLTGAISGTGQLTKTGNGTLILTATNTYSGGTLLDNGTLQGTTTSLQGNIVNNSSLVFEQNTDGTYAGNISGIGIFTKNGTGTVTLSGTNTFTGGSTITAGHIIGNTTSIQDDVNITNAASSLTLDGAGTYAGVVSGIGSLVKTGAGTLVLSGANTHTGGTTISAGTVSISANNNLGGVGNVVTLNGGTILLGAGGITEAHNTVLGVSNGTIDTNGNDGTFSGILSGAGSLTKTGAGTLTLTGTNTYAGGTTVSAGTLQGNTASLQGDILNNSILSFNQAGDGTFADVISGTGAVNSINNAVLTLSGINTYTGGTSVSGGGTVAITAESGLGGVGGALTLNNGTLRYDGAFSTARTTSLAGAGTVNTNGNAVTMSGVISGAGSLTKTGTGTLTLTGTNTYAGGTTVSAGTLQGNTTSLQGDIVNNATLTFDQGADGTFADVISGTGAVNSINNAVLTLSGVNTYTGGTSISGGGTVAITAESGLGGVGGALTLNNGTLRYDGAFSTARTTSLAGAGTVNTNGNAVTMSGVISGAGSLTKTGTGTLTLTGTNTYAGGTTVSAGTLQGNTTSLQGDIVNNATLTFDQAGAGTYADVISGTGAVNKTGGGTLTLSGTNTFTGGTFITGGAISITADANLGDVASDATLDGAALILGGALTSARDYTLGGANGTIDTNGNDGTFSGILSGAGSLTKTGTGTLTLTGTNTYAGGTTVSAGTLQGNTASLQGDILNNSILSFNQAGDGTFADVISGTGAVNSINNAVLTLSGVNTYTGGTSVSGGGTVAITAESGLGGVGGALTLNNGTLRYDGAFSTARTTSLAGAGTVNTNGNAVTMSGVISGAGSLTKTGTGTLTLTGTNTYAGGTTVSAGTLQGNTTSLQGDIVNNATLTFDQGADGTFADVISGTGAVNSINNAVLTLSGVNTYTGGTSVSGGGTVAITAESGLGGVGGALTLNNGTLRYDGAFSTARTTSLAGAGTVNTNGNAVTMSGVISGAGSLTKTGTGTLTLTGTNTYAGGTTVSAGTLQGNTTSLQGNITNNATLTFDQAGAGTYADVISGTGAVNKTGGGNVTLSGVNTYSGATTVSGGRLSVNGSIANSTTTIDLGAELGGTGTTGNLIADGTLAPGNSIGTINVAGNLTFNPGSTYAVEVDDLGNSDLTIATGAITINGGTVDVTAAAGDYAASTDYTILQGASVAGTFDTLLDNFAFLDGTLIYNAADVVLRLERNDLGFSDMAKDDVQFDVATALEELGGGNDLYDALVGMTTEQARDAFDQLSGESIAGTTGVIAATADTVRNVVTNRMMTLMNGAGISGNETNYTPDGDTTNTSPESIEPAAGGEEDLSYDDFVKVAHRQSEEYQLWAEVTASRGQSLAQDTAPEQTRGSGGVMLGMDRRLDDNGYFGIYAGAERGEIEVDSQNASSTVDSYHMGAYRTKPLKNDWRVSGGAGASFHDIDSTRYVLIPGFTAKAEGNTTGVSVNGFVEVSKQYKTPMNFRIEPYASLNTSASHVAGFSETGGGAANLRADTTTDANIGHTIGLRIGKTLVGPNDFRLALRGAAGWQHTYGDTRGGTRMHLTNGTIPFTVYGPKRPNDSAVLSLAADTLLGGDMTGYAHYDGILAKADQDHKISVGLKIPFSAFDRKDDPVTFNQNPPAISDIPEIKSPQPVEAAPIEKQHRTFTPQLIEPAAGKASSNKAALNQIFPYAADESDEITEIHTSQTLSVGLQSAEKPQADTPKTQRPAFDEKAALSQILPYADLEPAAGDE